MTLSTRKIFRIHKMTITVSLSTLLFLAMSTTGRSNIRRLPLSALVDGMMTRGFAHGPWGMMNIEGKGVVERVAAA
jgi:hypothetical protein